MFDSPRRKGLGALASEESTSEPWVQKRTKSGDTLAVLAEVYGVTAKEIVLKNGVPWGTTSINNWVKAIGGKLLPTGWFVFTADTSILLPPTPRRDGEPASTDGGRASTGLVVASPSPLPKLVVALGVAGAAAMLLFSKKSNKAKG